MLTLIISTLFIFMLAGVCIKLALRNSLDMNITWTEFAVGSAIGCVFIPIFVYSSYTYSQSAQRVYNEYKNGWETAANEIPITCTRDGQCRWAYDCDPYLVSHESCTTDSKGNRSCTTYYTTEYHSCPYVKTEFDYHVFTTLGEFVIADNRFPENPDSHRWRASERVTDTVAQRAGIGAPEIWLATKRRLDSGYPGPVTKRGTYENFILASDRTILRQYSTKIAEYKKLGLLPQIATSVDFPYHSKKAYFVGYTPPPSEHWETIIEYLNAAVGTEMKGDVHLVIADAALIANAPEYAQSLKAFWQDTSELGRDCLSKNGILIVIGASNEKVAWAYAFTGMPVGNSEMTVALESQLRGVDLTTAAVLGSTRLIMPPAGAPHVDHGQGAVEDAVFGLSNPATKFQRVRMDGQSGFAYLARETPVPTSTQIMDGVITEIFSCIIWLVCAVRGGRSRLDTSSDIYFKPFSHRRF